MKRKTGHPKKVEIKTSSESDSETEAKPKKSVNGVNLGKDVSSVDIVSKNGYLFMKKAPKQIAATELKIIHNNVSSITMKQKLEP